jgi:hypothetical protein
MAVTGRNSRASFGIYGTNSWGVATSALNALHVTSDAGMTLSPQFSENETFNQGFYRNASIGDITAPDLTVQMDSRYEDYAYMLEACAMGSPATPVVISSTGGNAYRHVIDLAPSVSGRGITFAVEYGGASFAPFIQELTSARVYGFAEAVGSAGVIQESFRLLGSKPTITSSVNFNSTMASAAVPDFGNKVFRKAGVFRLNAQAAAVSLTAADAVQIEDASFEFTRVNDAPNVFGQDYIIEPADNGFPTVSLSVTFPRMNTVSANSMYTLLQAGGAWKGDLTYTGAAVYTGGASYTKQYQFPYLEPQEITLNLAGANQVKPTVRFIAKEVATAPTGMTGVTRPFRLTRVMANSLIAF